jgi:CDP-diacylglycerol--glycerol-3-phosphate 3-phosphatidyltransferase
MLKTWIDKTLLPLSNLLAILKIHPNLITLMGVVVTLMVPVEILQDQWVAAGLWLLGAGFFDLLDGTVARNRKLQGPFGAFWDSTLDRISEAFVFGGLLLYYGQHQQFPALLLTFSVCILSLLVPYTRARAEGLGIKCEVGVLPRPGRVILLVLGFFLQQPFWALVLVGALSLVTVLQRVERVWTETRGN